MLKLPFALLLACSAGTACATAFDVNNTSADLPDATPGDGLCHVAGGSAGADCTLRAAVMEANASAGSDVIFVPIGSSTVLSIAGRGEDNAATGDLDINESVTITTPYVTNVPRATIDANGIDRVFDVLADGEVTLHNLSITGGLADQPADYAGGGVRFMTSGLGQLVYTIDHCEFHHNVALQGGAILMGTSSDGLTYKIFDSHFHHNTALTKQDGYSLGYGSAIATGDINTGTSALEIHGSTFNDNVGQGDPGFLGGAAIHAQTTLTIENSTFVNNLPTAIRLYATQTTLSHVTITGSETGYLFISPSASLLYDSTLRNTIIAGNTVTDCNLGLGNWDHDYSLDSDGSCQLAGGTGNLPSTHPMLGPLALRHGDAPVRVPRPGSPALDSGDPLLESAGGSCIAHDQEFVNRPIEGDGAGSPRCDMGAVELEDVIFDDGFEWEPIIL